MNSDTVNPPAPLPPQDFPLALVTIIVKRESGLRFAKVTPKTARPAYYIPIEMLALSAGKDAWMRQIRFKCKEATCRKVIRACDTEGGEYCQACFDRAGEENERVDGMRD